MREKRVRDEVRGEGGEGPQLRVDDVELEIPTRELLSRHVK